jgi:hypothetical protein
MMGILNVEQIRWRIESLEVAPPPLPWVQKGGVAVVGLTEVGSFPRISSARVCDVRFQFRNRFREPLVEGKVHAGHKSGVLDVITNRDPG